MHTSFTGVWVPIVTPFLAGDAASIDHPALARLAQHLATQGISGLVVAATTGEGILLQPGEQDALLATLRAAVPQLPLVMGLSTASTHDAVARARVLSRLRPDGLLVTPPLYVRPSQDGIRRHLEAVTESADLPVLVYNIPYRTGCQVELETLQQLAQDPRVVGIKECGGSQERMQRLVNETSLRILSGDDAQNFMALCLGAHGVIAASAHVMPHWHVQMQALIRDNQWHQARDIADALQPVIRALFAEPSPAPLKALLHADGWCAPEVRLPFVPVSAGLHARLMTQRQALLSSAF